MSLSHRSRSLSKVAVIGSGQIGPDIALFFTKVLSPHGVRTVVVDVATDALERGRAKLEKKIRKGVESGAFTEDQRAEMLAHVEFTTDYDAIRGSEFVVEAATEDDALKGRIFGQVEALVSPDAILASNSSHLEPEVIFAGAKHPERTLVIHYFFPAERNLLVEIVPGGKTRPSYMMRNSGFVGIVHPGWARRSSTTESPSVNQRGTRLLLTLRATVCASS
jgi:enoyl-CoA hydratase/3-hydroxyacyl-CoA dehydrogenase